MSRQRAHVAWVFRLASVYFSLYVVTTQMLGSLLPLPVGERAGAGEPCLRCNKLVAWVAAHVFRVTSPLVVTGSGSGDKTFDWVHAFCVLVISLAHHVVWSVVDRHADLRSRLEKWFRLFVRFALGSTMVSYGMVKAIPLQMPPPTLTRLLEPYGYFSPMGVLWASVGASRAYEIVIGCAELTGGVLLFLPQTAPLGALICLIDTIQIFILNMTYDVPVKLFAFHLIVLSLLLLAPQIPQLFRVLVLSGFGTPSTDSEAVPSLRPGRRLVAAQILFGIYIVAINLYGARQAWWQYGGGAPKSPLYGIWNVDQMSIDGQIRSPLLTDYDRWRRVIFDRPGSMALQRMNDSFVFFVVTIDQRPARSRLRNRPTRDRTRCSLSALGAGSTGLDGEHEPSSHAHGAPLARSQGLPARESRLSLGAGISVQPLKSMVDSHDSFFRTSVCQSASGEHGCHVDPGHGKQIMHRPCRNGGPAR